MDDLHTIVTESQVVEILVIHQIMGQRSWFRGYIIFIDSHYWHPMPSSKIRLQGRHFQSMLMLRLTFEHQGNDAAASAGSIEGRRNAKGACLKQCLACHQPARLPSWM